MVASNGISLAAFIGACVLAAMPGIFLRPGQWYENLAKPRWRPPNWLFGPVWALLYLSVAVAGWLVWRSGELAQTGFALAIYGLQLVLNAGWSALFFGLRRPDLAFGELVLMWLAILATILAFHPIEPRAALLMLPYLSWVTFAGALNYSVWRRNQDRIGRQPVTMRGPNP